MFALPSKTPAEAKVVTFDFSGEAAVGAVLSSPTVTKTLISGSDTGAAALTLSGAAVPAGTQTVTVLVAGGLDACFYKLHCTVTGTNTGGTETHEREAKLGVSTSAV